LSENNDPVENPDNSKPKDGGSSKDVKLEFIGAIEEGGVLSGAFSFPEGSYLVTRDASGTNYSITYSSGSSSDAGIKDLQSKAQFAIPGSQEYDDYFRKLGKEILGNFFKLVKRVPHWQMEKSVNEDDQDKQEEEPEQPGQEKPKSEVEVRDDQPPDDDSLGDESI
jgi:hypothetical protein